MLEMLEQRVLCTTSETLATNRDSTNTLMGPVAVMQGPPTTNPTAYTGKDVSTTPFHAVNSTINSPGALGTNLKTSVSSVVSNNGGANPDPTDFGTGYAPAAPGGPAISVTPNGGVPVGTYTIVVTLTDPSSGIIVGTVKIQVTVKAP